MHKHGNLGWLAALIHINARSWHDSHDWQINWNSNCFRYLCFLLRCANNNNNAPKAQREKSAALELLNLYTCFTLRSHAFNEIVFDEPCGIEFEKCTTLIPCTCELWTHSRKREEEGEAEVEKKINSAPLACINWRQSDNQEPLHRTTATCILIAECGVRGVECAIYTLTNCIRMVVNNANVGCPVRLKCATPTSRGLPSQTCNDNANI